MIVEGRYVLHLLSISVCHLDQTGETACTAKKGKPLWAAVDMKWWRGPAPAYIPDSGSLNFCELKLSELISPICFLCTHLFQHGKAELCGSLSQQNWGHADQTAKQPGGHQNAKSTSKSTHTHTCMYTHTHTHTGPWQSFYPTDRNTTHTPAHLLLSSHRRGSFHTSNFKNTCALTHRHTQTSISSSYDKSEKAAAGQGCWGREGGANCIGKKQWRFFPLVNDFPFMKLREGCISIQPCWSLHDSIGKWPAVIKQCGGKNTEEYSEERLTFFTVLNFTRVNKSPKEKRIKSTPQPPQFSKTPGPGERLTRLLLVGGMARWLTGVRRKLVPVEVLI